MHDCIFGCNMHPCPVTHLVYANRYVPSDSSLPLPAAHSGPISPYIEIWGKRGRKRILSLSFVSFCVSASNYLYLLPVKPQIVSYYEVTTTTYSSISFADAGPLARASNLPGGVPANPYPLVALRATRGTGHRKQPRGY